MSESPEIFKPLTLTQVEKMLEAVRRDPRTTSQDRIMPRAALVSYAEQFAQNYLWLLDRYVDQNRTLLSFAEAQAKP